MEKRENICDNEVCNWYIQKEKLEPKTIKLQGKAMELLPGIYRFCLSPGIAERKIYQKLKDLYGADHVFYIHMWTDMILMFRKMERRYIWILRM